MRAASHSSPQSEPLALKSLSPGAALADMTASDPKEKTFALLSMVPDAKELGIRPDGQNRRKVCLSKW